MSNNNEVLVVVWSSGKKVEQKNLGSAHDEGVIYCNR